MFVVYQAYGIQDVLEQTLFSVLSLLHVSPAESDLRAMVYTDRPDYFSTFFNGHPRVEIVAVPMEQFKAWRGTIDFVHRVKLEVLRSAGQRFSGSLLYCDGDTYFLKSPKPLFEKIDDQQSIMHIAEAELGQGKDPLTKKICKFAKNSQFQLDGEVVPLSPATVMWNAGVIGISENNKRLLEEMLTLTDAMFVVYPKHVIEQLAVSIVLQWRTKIEASDHAVYHYWNQKPEYQTQIQKFFASFPEVKSALENYSRFQFPAKPQPKTRSGFLWKFLQLQS